MSTFNVTYSHAAPFIREKLIDAVRSACDSRTKKGREAHFQAAFAYADCLQIMRMSGDTELAEGISHEESFNKKDLARVARFLGSRFTFSDLMGIEAVEPATDEWYGR